MKRKNVGGWGRVSIKFLNGVKSAGFDSFKNVKKFRFYAEPGSININIRICIDKFQTLYIYIQISIYLHKSNQGKNFEWD